MTPVPADDFLAIVSQMRAELAQRQGPPASRDRSDADSPMLITVDEYSTGTAAAPVDQAVLQDGLHSLLLEARAYPIRITGWASSPEQLRVASGHDDSQPQWNPLRVPHESEFPPLYEKVAVGGPRLNRRARRRAAHRRGSSS